MVIWRFSGPPSSLPPLPSARRANRAVFLLSDGKQEGFNPVDNCGANCKPPPWGTATGPCGGRCAGAWYCLDENIPYGTGSLNDYPICIAQRLKDAGIRIYTAGFGSANATQLEVMATEPASENSFFGSSITDVQVEVCAPPAPRLSPRPTL